MVGIGVSTLSVYSSPEPTQISAGAPTRIYSLE